MLRHDCSACSHEQSEEQIERGLNCTSHMALHDIRRKSSTSVRATVECVVECSSGRVIQQKVPALLSSLLAPSQTERRQLTAVRRVERRSAVRVRAARASIILSHHCMQTHMLLQPCAKQHRHQRAAPHAKVAISTVERFIAYPPKFSG